MFYQKSSEAVIDELRTDINTGLTEKEARLRLSKYGPNLLPSKKKPSLLHKFIEQFKDFLIIILLLATIVSFALGETLDAIVIAAIVLINATIGFIQEIKAEKTLESLQEKEILYTLVIRSGEIEKIPSEEIVPGDVLILEEGAKIPADCRIVESFSLRVDESILTGESLPLSKNPKTILEKISLADRKNMVFKDTEIAAGRGKAVVVATGKKSEIGKIAVFLSEEKESKTPLTIELEKVGRTISYIVLMISVIIFFLNYIKHVPLIESLLISISLAVAAIPEGLPAIVTIVLSFGVERLAGKRTVTKKLPSVETLGAVRIIATDKTGTLTQNKISVVKTVLADFKEFTLEGENYKPVGTFFDRNNKIINPMGFPKLNSLLEAGILANNASYHIDRNELIGDTTEGALLVAAARANIDIDEVKNSRPRIYEVPFSSERKMMSVVVEVNQTGSHMLYAKGAPEIIFGKCEMTESEKKKFQEIVRKFAQEGLRSLAIAEKKISLEVVKKALEEENLTEDKFHLLGIVGMQDPLRSEVREAIFAAKEAGIRTIMITGDHKETAVNIAIQAGIAKKGDQVMTEEEISNLSKEKIALVVHQGCSVFARISPMGKLKIVEALKTLPNAMIAVTGDGVNDAPSLKASHIGIAMGKTGTDITREVADLVITDDNYATIIDAIKEGRIIFANLVKFIRYLISCNLSEVLVVAAGVIFSTPMPLLPIQILWINLITDGLPALALGVDPAEYDVMKRPPRDLSQGILHKKRLLYMMLEGSVMGITVFALFLFALDRFSYQTAQTMAFTALAFTQLIHAFNNRSIRKSLFQIGIFSNKALIIAVVISVFLQVIIIQTATGNIIFKTVKLDFLCWLFIALVSLVPFIVVETKKQLRFRILP